MSITQTPGLSCPECETRITVDITDLLVNGKVVCPSCNLELFLDQEKSRESIQVLRKFHAEFVAVQNHYEESIEAYTEESTEHSRRRTRRTTTRRRRRSHV